MDVEGCKKDETLESPLLTDYNQATVEKSIIFPFPIIFGSVCSKMIKD